MGAVVKQVGVFTDLPVAAPGYPDASNTGVPVGTSLTLHNSDFTTSSNGQVVDSLDIRGSLIINHSGVVVTKCKISQWSIFGAYCEGPGHSMTMEDCTIDGGVNPGTCAVNSNFTMRRCDIKGAENGFDVGTNVLIEDCFVHDLYNGGGDPHADCLQFNDGSSDITIQHNTFLSRGADGSDTTSCIIAGAQVTAMTNITIHDNVMAGGAYSLYGLIGATATNMVVTDNKFWELWFSGKSGFFGTWSDVTDESVVTGNQLGSFSGGYDSTNKLILGTWSGTAL